jgi:hypothetical protein
MFNKIISLLKKEKFNIVCKDKKEWENTQLELFKQGYRWEISGQTLAYCEWKYPLVIKNYRNGDRFGSKILIMDEYNFMIKSGKTGNVKFTNATSYMRNEKIKRIKW